MNHRHRPNPRHRGGIYIAVLATSTIVAVIGLASMAAWHLQGAAANASADAAEARLYAEAGLDTAADYLSKNPTTWRTAKPQGVWSANVPFAHGSFTIAGADPIDANFANRPYDPLVLTCTGTKGTATHIASVTLKAQGTPIAALAMAVHTAGQFRVNSGTLTATGAPISTNGTLRADGTVTGSAQCTLSIGSGTVTGGITLLAPNKPMPPAGIKAMYQALATTISPGSSIDRKILAPGLNNTVAGGPTNADGVYYISTTNDTTISNCRINGTLIVDCPGKTVTISGAMFMAPARTDYPVLIVNGKLVLQTSGGTLSEATLTTNFNPTGAPYQGTTDSDQLDTYPGEIQGLVHCTDQLQILSSTIIRGCVICESTDGTQAVYTDNSPTIIYDPNLYATPPMGYTTSVIMKLAPGGWKQTVLP